MAGLDRTIMTRPVNYVVDSRIERFFDTVDHHWMMKCLRQRIVDRAFLRLIARFLKAGAVAEGQYLKTEAGTPQGSIISPVLANIYLRYVLDLWFERSVQRRLRGYGGLTRYADDFVVCFQSEREARSFERELRQRLARFGLRIAEGKSRTIEFGRYRWQAARQRGERLATFDFLGFTHYCDRTREGGFKVGRKTARTRLNRALVTINKWLKWIRNQIPVREWWPMLAAKLRGHYCYYGVRGNTRSLHSFYYRVLRMAYKWLNRRSQKASYTWEEYCRRLRFLPLPLPRIGHGWA